MGERTFNWHRPTDRPPPTRPGDEWANSESGVFVIRMRVRACVCVLAVVCYVHLRSIMSTTTRGEHLSHRWCSRRPTLPHRYIFNFHTLCDTMG